MIQELIERVDALKRENAALRAKQSRLHPLEAIAPGGGEVPATAALKKESFQLTGYPNVEDKDPGSYVKMTCSRSNLRAVGWTDVDFKKPIITVGVPFTNIMPCEPKNKCPSLFYSPMRTRKPTIRQ